MTEQWLEMQGYIVLLLSSNTTLKLTALTRTGVQNHTP